MEQQASEPLNADEATGFVSDGNPNRPLVAGDFNTVGDIKAIDAKLALVVGSAQTARDFIENKQWNMLWRDADLLFQSPRPMSVYENTSTEWGTLLQR
jgi:hypothetical protein